MLIAIRSALYLLIFYIFSVPYVLAAVAAVPLGYRAIGKVATGWAWFQRICMRLIVGQRVVVEGHLPPGAHFIAAKHEAMFETVDMLILLDRPVIAAKRELLDIPFWGYAARRYGLIPVDRGGGGKALRAVLAAAKRGMAQGRPILFFPEGTRVPHGERPPLRPGFAGLYALLGVPVVPVALDSGRVGGKGTWLRPPGTITYRIGEPIPAGLPRAEVEARVHEAINVLNG